MRERDASPTCRPYAAVMPARPFASLRRDLAVLKIMVAGLYALLLAVLNAPPLVSPMNAIPRFSASGLASVTSIPSRPVRSAKISPTSRPSSRADGTLAGGSKQMRDTRTAAPPGLLPSFLRPSGYSLYLALMQRFSNPTIPIFQVCRS